MGVVWQLDGDRSLPTSPFAFGTCRSSKGSTGELDLQMWARDQPNQDAERDKRSRCEQWRGKGDRAFDHAEREMIFFRQVFEEGEGMKECAGQTYCRGGRADNSQAKSESRGRELI